MYLSIYVSIIVCEGLGTRNDLHKEVNQPGTKATYRLRSLKEGH